MKRWAFGLLVVAVFGSAAVAQDGVRTARLPDGHSGAQSKAAAALDQTAAAQKFAFVFFWKDQNPQTGRAWSVLQAAAGNMSDSADVIAVQASDPSEKAVVDRFGTSRAPMPLVLAVAPCGAVTKAFTSAFDESQLRTALVSPGTQLCLKALQDRKLVLLCVVDQAGPNGVGNAGGGPRIQGRPTVRPRVGDRAGQCGRRRGGRILEGTEGGCEGAHAVHGLARSSRQRRSANSTVGRARTKCWPNWLRPSRTRAPAVPAVRVDAGRRNRCRTVASCMATWACKACWSPAFRLPGQAEAWTPTWVAARRPR